MQGSARDRRTKGNGLKQIRRGLKGAGGFFLLLAVLERPASAQSKIELAPGCVVQIGTQTAIVQPDGSYQIRNVPLLQTRDTGTGLQLLERVRAVCQENGQIIRGQSDFLEIPANGFVGLTDVFAADVSPIPSVVRISAPEDLLGVGETLQLLVTASFPDGAQADVTLRSEGSTYLSSNPRVASVTQDGLVTAQQVEGSQTVMIFATNQGPIASFRLTVSASDDLDQDGILNSWERRFGFNPRDPADALADPDRDGLTNLQEFERGTDPTDPDTDRDTFRDGVDGDPLRPEGNPPVVMINSPSNGDSVVEGTALVFDVSASDDGLLASVELVTDTGFFRRFTAPPFRATIVAPIGVSAIKFTATARDASGNLTPEEVDVTVTVGSLTSVVGRVVDDQGNGVAGAEVVALGDVFGFSQADGTFTLPGVRTSFGPLVVRATLPGGGGDLDGLSLPTAPVPSGVTDVGDIVLSQLFGDGADGQLMVSAAGEIVNAAKKLVADAVARATAVSVTDTADISAGDEVMVIQLQGPGAGTYEFARVTAVTGTAVSLASPLMHAYSATNRVANLVRVPNFTDVTVPAGKSLTAPEWDGSRGGILVFRAMGTVLVEQGGRIDAKGTGFRGGRAITNINPCNPAAGFQGESILGPSTALGVASPNVGGGGAGAPNSCVGCGGDSPGGGAGHGTTGTDSLNPGGPSFAGLGGNTYGSPDLLSGIFLGSGGGESHWAGFPGGDGGGIVAIFGRTVRTSMGEIAADGSEGSTGFGHPSGAGSGGSVLILADEIQAGEERVHARGGAGSSQTPCTACCGSFELEKGGDGGFGRILLRARQTDGTVEGCAPRPTGLANWWPGDGSTSDLVGGFAGSFRGAPSFSNGKVGRAFRFNGGNSVFVNQMFVLHEPIDATVEFWVNPDNPFFDQAVFWTRPDDSDANRFNILVNGGSIIIDYRQPNGGLHPLGSTPIPTRAWTHIAIVRTVQPVHTYRIYKNGLLASERTDPTPNLPTAFGWQMTGRGCCMFRGGLDEVTTYRRALRAVEVRSLFEANGFGKCQP